MFWRNASFYLRDTFRIERKRSHTQAVGRTHSAISVRLRGRTVFRTGEGSLCVEPGDVLLIPAGVDYWIDNSDEELIILHVDAYGEIPRRLQRFSPQNPGQVMERFRQLHQRWQMQEPGCRSVCTAMLYEIFASLDREQAPAGKFALLEPGIRCLNDRLGDPSLNVRQLAEACRISQVYFRRLFREFYGCSPAAAIRRRRLQRAAKLLESTDYSVAEVASMCGFPDVKYFSTAFKSDMGATPSGWRRGNARETG